MVQLADRPKNAAITATHTDIVTTAQIAETLRHPADGRLNHAVAVAKPIDLPTRDLPFPPYAFGVWLGDGNTQSARFTSADPQIAAEIEAEGLRVVKSPKVRLGYTIRLCDPSSLGQRACAVCGRSFTPKTSQVRTCGRTCGGRSRSDKWHPSWVPAVPFALIADGHQAGEGGARPAGITTEPHRRSSVAWAYSAISTFRSYLRASEKQRRALLAGLLDTDGTVTLTGSVQFSVTSLRLATDVRELVMSLGYRCGWSESACSARPRRLPSLTRLPSRRPMTSSA